LQADFTFGTTITAPIRLRCAEKKHSQEKAQKSRGRIKKARGFMFLTKRPRN
jgi:hypothetical protein